MKRLKRLLLCSTLAGALSCSAEKLTGPAPVASVSIEVVGDTVLLPTQQTLLVAVIRDSRNNILNDRTVEWSSSNPNVVAIAQTGWLTAVGVGSATLAAACEGKATTVAVRVRPVPVASVVVTVQGDTTVEDGTTRVLTATARDSVGNVLPGRAFTWSSSDTSVATVTSSGLVRGVWEGSVRISAVAEGRSDTVGLRVVPRAVASVTVNIGGFGALYAPNDTRVLTVTLRAANGDSLDPSRRPVTWSSSNAGVATVAQTGVVTSVSAGPVTITASREGRSGTANLTVLPAPVVNWASAADWVTYQADAQRTGHVKAVADPRTFHLLWTKTVAGGTGLSPAVASNGRVFVATESYFGVQLLVALSAANGQQLWVENFGPIHGVHQPAVGNGRVYVTTSGHENSFLYAFDGASGVRAFRTRYGNQWERYFAPIVTPTAVYMAGGYYGGMYRFDAMTGDSVWFFQTNQYDSWTPALRDTVVYTYTGSYAPKVTANRASNGALLYDIPDSSFSWNGWSMHTSPVLGSDNNLLAVHNNRLVMFDLGTQTVRWERVDQYKGMVSLSAGVLYVVNGDGIEARSETNGALLWSWHVPVGNALPLPALALTDNLLFISTGTVTFALDLQGRSAVWSYPAGGRLSLSSDGILYIAQANGTLSAVALQ